MKRKLRSVLSFIMIMLVISNAYISVNASEPDYSLWDKFIKYDLCITDYDSLTDEEKELCKFIFDTEQTSDESIRCERARRVIAHDENIGERITIEQLNDEYGIWDRYSPNKVGWESYIRVQNLKQNNIHRQLAVDNDKELS